MHRVVITGMGIFGPHGHGLETFEAALRTGKSGIRFVPEMQQFGFTCQVAGVPECAPSVGASYFGTEALRYMSGASLLGAIAAVDCWRDARLPFPVAEDRLDPDTGAIIGSAMGALDVAGESLFPSMEARNIRRLGSSAAEKLMCSGISARIAGVLGLGGAVTTNSSACATGTEAVIDAYHKLRRGMGLRYLVGAAENASPYSWAPFDALRVLTRGFNDTPERASRPLSASSTGFVPAGGAGVLMLESLESALQRGARIYAEVTGGAVNCGGQRQGGSMTARNNGSARRCIETATAEAGITGADVDLISGHLTGTRADVDEVSLWMESLGLTPESMPLINSPISLTGHLLGAAGSVGCIAAVLQIHKSFVHPSANCEDLLSSLEPFRASIPHTAVKRHVETVCKASFGFGDVNACVVFRKWSSPN